MSYKSLTLYMPVFVYQDVKCRLWSNNLKATAWDSIMAATKITVRWWKHLLTVGRPDNFCSGEWLSSINILKSKVLKHKNLCNPKKLDVNHWNVFQQNSNLTLACQHVLSVRSTTVWWRIWETLCWDSFAAFSGPWIYLPFSSHWLSKKNLTNSPSVFFLHPSRAEGSIKLPSHHCLFWLLITTFPDYPLSNNTVSESTFQRQTCWKSAVCSLFSPYIPYLTTTKAISGCHPFMYYFQQFNHLLVIIC